MRLFIPALGTKLDLVADWTFPLHPEERNSSLAEPFGLPDVFRDPTRTVWRREEALRREGMSWDEASNQVRATLKVPQDITLVAGTRLVLDRIYIRQGAGEFDSVTFRIVSSPDPRLRNKKKLRFWAKLADVNRVECTLVNDDAGAVAPAPAPAPAQAQAQAQARTPVAPPVPAAGGPVLRVPTDNMPAMLTSHAQLSRPQQELLSRHSTLADQEADLLRHGPARGDRVALERQITLFKAARADWPRLISAILGDAALRRHCAAFKSGRLPMLVQRILPCPLLDGPTMTAWWDDTIRLAWLLRLPLEQRPAELIDALRTRLIQVEIPDEMALDTAGLLDAFKARGDAAPGFFVDMPNWPELEAYFHERHRLGALLAERLLTEAPLEAVTTSALLMQISQAALPLGDRRELASVVAYVLDVLRQRHALWTAIRADDEPAIRRLSRCDDILRLPR